MRRFLRDSESAKECTLSSKDGWKHGFAPSHRSSLGSVLGNGTIAFCSSFGATFSARWLLFTRGRCHAAALGWACQCFEECLEDRTPPSPRTPGACIAETISPGHWYGMESPADSADSAEPRTLRPGRRRLAHASPSKLVSLRSGPSWCHSWRRTSPHVVRNLSGQFAGV